MDIINGDTLYNEPKPQIYIEQSEKKLDVNGYSY